VSTAARIFRFAASTAYELEHGEFIPPSSLRRTRETFSSRIIQRHASPGWRIHQTAKIACSIDPHWHSRWDSMTVAPPERGFGRGKHNLAERPTLSICKPARSLAKRKKSFRFQVSFRNSEIRRGGQVKPPNEFRPTTPPPGSTPLRSTRPHCSSYHRDGAGPVAKCLFAASAASHRVGIHSSGCPTIPVGAVRLSHASAAMTICIIAPTSVPVNLISRASPPIARRRVRDRFGAVLVFPRNQRRRSESAKGASLNPPPRWVGNSFE